MAAARRKLRQAFFTAEMGISGANFLVADAGVVAISTNEGNGRLCTSVPRIHVVVTGIEKVIPRLEDLAVLWPVLATSGTGQGITTYSTLIGGPRRPEEVDGPEEFHVVLVDNGRSQLLADAEQREVLHCIRCGACLNICPVFRHVGGHTYGTTYPGPIGSVLTPHLAGIKEFKHLSYASSLCGACTSVCPVKIDLHHHLLQNRRNATEAGATKSSERMMFRAWRHAMAHPGIYALGGWSMRKVLRIIYGLGLAGHSLIRCGCGIVIARPCLCHPNRSAHAGEKILVQTENPSRERILERIRTGLRTIVADSAELKSRGEIFERINNPLERFQQECVANLMECVLTADCAASGRQLSKVLELVPEGEVFVQDAPSLRRLVELAEPGRLIRWSSQGAPREASQATVTLAEALIAQTGSILVTASCGGRGASVVAPCHIVYATVAQLVPDLATALRGVAQEGTLDRNSFACVISGSSRTADIEKILVQGAHGPRRLVVILQTTN